MCVLAFGVYVYVGGYLAVVWTDLIQLGILLVGFCAIIVKAIPAAGGWAAIEAAYTAADADQHQSQAAAQTVGGTGPAAPETVGDGSHGGTGADHGRADGAENQQHVQAAPTPGVLTYVAE